MDNINKYLFEKLVINKNIKDSNTFTFNLDNKRYKSITVSLPFNINLVEEDKTISIHYVEEDISDVTQMEIYKFFDEHHNLIMKLSKELGIENLFFPTKLSTIAPKIYEINGKYFGKRSKIELESEDCILEINKA